MLISTSHIVDLLLFFYLQILNKVIAYYRFCYSFSSSIFYCLVYEVLSHLKNINLYINEILDVTMKFQSNPSSEQIEDINGQN
jgi:hypothetical protein